MLYLLLDFGDQGYDGNGAKPGLAAHLTAPLSILVQYTAKQHIPHYIASRHIVPVQYLYFPTG